MGVIGALGVISAKNFMELRAKRTLKDGGATMLLFLPLDTPPQNHPILMKNIYSKGPGDYAMNERVFLEKGVFPWKMTTVKKSFKNNEDNSRILLDLFKKLKHKDHIGDETLSTLLFSITEKGE